MQAFPLTVGPPSAKSVLLARNVVHGTMCLLGVQFCAASERVLTGSRLVV